MRKLKLFVGVVTLFGDEQARRFIHFRSVKTYNDPIKMDKAIITITERLLLQVSQ